MIHEKVCEHCNRTYNAAKSNQKYCSNSCRTRACYDRNNYKYKKGAFTPKTTVRDELKAVEKDLIALIDKKDKKVHKQMDRIEDKLDKILKKLKN